MLKRRKVSVDRLSVGESEEPRPKLQCDKEGLRDGGEAGPLMSKVLEGFY